ncbi:zinc ribbon domain-containing protein [Streptomyces yanii]|uniref:Zinc ribbon domain-containing protein n=1 Tax=Streptomyces yanii TaxID=78510 RepID=A0ABV5RCY8_9ACTN
MRRTGRDGRRPPQHLSAVPSTRAYAKENRPSRNKFHCVACGHYAHADTVGALNILRAGLVRREAQPAWREAPTLGSGRSHKHRRVRAVLCCVGQRRVPQLVERHLPPD